MKGIKISLGIYGLENHFNGDMEKVIEVVRIADDLGYDRMVMTDHVIMGDRTDRYPYGDFTSDPDRDWYEPIVTLSAIAGATSHIRLSTAVLIAPLRPPVLLAKMIATLDQLSKGRLDLGVGVGWQKEEYDALGIPFEKRGQRLEDQLRACKALWSQCPATFKSETVSFGNVYCRPEPFQKGGVPLWFGLAPTEANCRRIAELGVGWLPIVSDPQKVAEGISAIKSAFLKVGRDPEELRVQGGVQFGERGKPSVETFRQLEKAIEIGITDIQVFPAFMVGSADGLRSCLENILTIKNS